jgi:uncharacterized protein YhbP (UPF0306 family)
MTLATCAEGTPWATDVYFAPSGYDLIFLSAPDSRHCRNLAARPACAATVHPLTLDWREIRGLQMEGVARPVTNVSAKARALAAYYRKFPFVRDLLSRPSEAARKLGKTSALVFRPSRISYLDNSAGFGARYAVLLKDCAPVGPPVRDDSG